MGRCPKDEPTGKNLVCRKALPISEKNWKNLLGSGIQPPPPLAIGGLKCKEQKRYMTHQRNIEHKLKKLYGKTTKENLKRVRTLLKQDLTAECEKLRKKNC